MQVSYTMYPGLSRLGQILDAFSPRVVSAKIARGIVRAGFGVFRVPTIGGAGTSFGDPGESFQNPTPPVAVNASALLTGGVSSASLQTITAFNGAFGGIEMQPARNVTMVLSNHANWSATTAVLKGYNQNGQLVSENLTIPSSGNVTLTSVNVYKSLVSLVIPVQGGASGTYTLGVTVLNGSIAITDFQGVAAYSPLHMPAASVNQLFNTANIGIGGPNQSPWGVAGANSGSLAIGEYGDNDSFDCLEVGPISVFTEVATKDGDPVFVRIASGANGTQLGAFGNVADSASCVQVVGAKFIRDLTSGQGHVRFK